MRKTRIKNTKRFIVSMVILALVIALIMCAVLFAIKRLGAQTKPLGDDDYNSELTPGGEKLSEEEIEKLNSELKRSKEVSDAQQKIKDASYPVDKVEDFDLILVNKTHGLSSSYKPDDMVVFDRFVAGVGSEETHKLRKVAADALNKMFDAAEADGIELKLRTGFRSFDYQTNLYNSYVTKNGQADADTYSARPGFSEHQSGLACDLGGATEGFALSYNFGETKEGQWVADHAHEYGFIIRFTDGKTVNGNRMPGEITGYVFEPWHIRYVGKDHAATIKQLGITLEEYLGIVDEAKYVDQ